MHTPAIRGKRAAFVCSPFCCSSSFVVVPSDFPLLFVAAVALPLPLPLLWFVRRTGQDRPPLKQSSQQQGQGEQSKEGGRGKRRSDADRAGPACWLTRGMSPALCFVPRLAWAAQPTGPPQPAATGTHRVPDAAFLRGVVLSLPSALLSKRAALPALLPVACCCDRRPWRPL
jgi:hypothetical protein